MKIVDVLDISGVYMGEPHIIKWQRLHNKNGGHECRCLRCRALYVLEAPVSILYTKLRGLKNGGWNYE